MHAAFETDTKVSFSLTGAKGSSGRLGLPLDREAKVRLVLSRILRDQFKTDLILFR